MLDQRFYKKSPPYRLSVIAGLINCQVQPALTEQNDLMIDEIKPLQVAGTGHLSFLSNLKYIAEFKATQASACLVAENFQPVLDSAVILLKTPNPYFSYTKLINLFYRRAATYEDQIAASAYVASSAKLGKNCYIGHNVVINDHCLIGDDSVIESGTVIDCGVVIGKRAMIYSNVSISYSVIGDDVIILAGAKIGQDGFGFATDGGIHYKIFHTGIVKIGHNVEIGANTTIDRGSIQDTVIGDLCRIDNLVQIGHNVQIDRGSIIVAQVGIAGSSKIGQYCALGGQVGIAGHLVVGDRAQIAAQSGVLKDVQPAAKMAGHPAMPIRQWYRQAITLKKLLTKDQNSEY